MTTRITTPADEDAYPTERPQFENHGSPTDGAPRMFSPTSSATAGQFDTDADQQR